MRYIWQHIRFIIDNYDGSVPLAHFLKNYYKQNPKLGSRDRKILGNMAYSWYRCNRGLAMPEEQNTFEQRIWAGLLACDLPVHDVLFADYAQPEYKLDLHLLFQHTVDFSQGIDREQWQQSMLQQPSLFIRIRNDKNKIISILSEQKIPFEFISDNCLSLPNGAKIDTLLPPDSYVVQDASSQQTGQYFAAQKNERWYDCCAGAGGKSILLKDMYPSVQLTVSDRRESILHNLHDRFRLYHHTQPVGKLTDAADKTKLAVTFGSQLFDNIICDAPCSGSGTWARTPEQLYFFDPSSLEQFHNTQSAIAANVAAYLKPGGRLIYITCSVFKRENEAVVASVIKETGLVLHESKLINGLNIKADCMYVAVLKKL